MACAACRSELIADDSVRDAGEPQAGLDAIESSKSDDSKGSLMCRTSSAVECLSYGSLKHLTQQHQRDKSLLTRRMSM